MNLPVIDNKTLITPTSGFLAPDGDITHSLNAFVGCSHGNSLCGGFCYAREMPQFHDRDFARPAFKRNALEAYRADYDRIKRPVRGTPRPLGIFMSSVTDPYLPQEKSLCLTQRLLQEMLDRPPDALVIQTHATLIGRDIDLIAELARRCSVLVSVTVETDLERLPGFPAHASSPARRIKVLKEFRDRGVPTQAAISPLLPLAHPEGFARALEGACDRVTLDHWLIGDGSKHGARTKSTGFPARLAEAGFGEWTTLEKFEQIKAVFAGVFGPDRLFVGRAGFTTVRKRPTAPPTATAAASGPAVASATAPNAAAARKQPALAARPSLPPVTAYEVFDRFIRGFLEGTMSQLVIGPAGTQKSTTIRHLLGDRVTGVTGHATAWGLYCDLYHHRDRHLVLDDLDQLYAKADVVALLKCLAEKAPRKTLAWRSDRTREDQDVPRSFTTTSRVIIVANRWACGNEDILALEDRCIKVVFRPTPAQVHARASSWMSRQDREVYEFVGANLGRCQSLSMRVYDHAMEYKRYGADWKQFVLRMLDAESQDTAAAAANPLEVVRELVAMNSLTRRERVRQFHERTGQSQATFYRLREQLLSEQG